MARAVAFCIALVVIVSSPLTRGQQAADAPAAPLPAAVMSGADAQAFVDAAASGLDYLPGEVVVKFKDGVDARAASSARSTRCAAVRRSDRLEWAGEVAVLRDPSQPDAHVLADQLAAQPEVAYAEPNYLRHKSLTPNDTGFAPRQWNLQTIDMPQAWDINPGGEVRASSSRSSTPASPTFIGTMTVARRGTGARSRRSSCLHDQPDLAAIRLVSPDRLRHQRRDHGCSTPTATART